MSYSFFVSSSLFFFFCSSVAHGLSEWEWKWMTSCRFIPFLLSHRLPSDEVCANMCWLSLLMTEQVSEPMGDWIFTRTRLKIKYRILNNFFSCFFNVFCLMNFMNDNDYYRNTIMFDWSLNGAFHKRSIYWFWLMWLLNEKKSNWKSLK